MADPKSDGRTRHGLIVLVALQRAKAMKDRREREAAEKAGDGKTKPKKRGWFG